MRVSSYILSFLAACILSACSNRPSHVLSEKQMEDILYDLYIAEAEVRQNVSIFQRDTLLRQDILQSVFDKHSITEERFDASLVWYNDNLDKYVRINERLGERYTIDIERLSTESEREKTEAQALDSVYLYSSASVILSSSLHENIFPFIISDSEELNTYKKYNIDFLPVGIKAPHYPVLTFSIDCQDTIFVFRDTIKNNFRYSNSQGVGRNYTINSVYGSIYLPVESTEPLLINDFSITQQKPQSSSEPSFKTR
ncbi:MAG: DUF4296 domain-containing protein [Bacteroidales bacterium]|nr:DUF4296 domain-containing protein [Bacteroidales bacterium]